MPPGDVALPPTCHVSADDALAQQATSHLLGLAPERFGDRTDLHLTAAAIADEARAHGFGQIDHLLPNADYSAFHAVQGALDDPQSLRAYIGRAQFLAHAAKSRSLEQVGDRLRETGAVLEANANGVVRGLLGSLDQNGDGKLNFSDVGAFFTRALDQNGDGKLNFSDVGALLDKTGDGKLGLDDAVVFVGGLLGGRRR